MHHTHFVLTNGKNLQDAIRNVDDYLSDATNEGKLDALGCDYYVVENAIDLSTGLGMAANRPLDPEFHTQEGIIKFFTKFCTERAQKDFTYHETELRKGIEEREPGSINYHARELAHAVECMKLIKEKPITIDRIINDRYFEITPYQWDMIGVTKLVEDATPFMVLVDLHT